MPVALKVSEEIVIEARTSLYGQCLIVCWAKETYWGEGEGKPPALKGVGEGYAAVLKGEEVEG